MAFIIFIKGAVTGFVLCAPLGPVGIWCLRKSIADGRPAGLAAFLGASTADGIYCTMAALGISYVSTFLTQQAMHIRLVGGGVLFLVGLKVLFTEPRERPATHKGRGPAEAYASGLLITLANPMIILVFTAALTAMGLHSAQGNYLPAVAMVAGVCSGSAIWGPILITALTLFKAQIIQLHHKWLNRIAGFLIMVFGAALAIVTLLKIPL